MLITIQMTRSKLQSSNCKVTIGRYQSLDLVLKYMNFHGLLKANPLSGGKKIALKINEVIAVVIWCFDKTEN